MLLLYLSYPYYPDPPLSTDEETYYLTDVTGQSGDQYVVSGPDIRTGIRFSITEGRNTEYLIRPVRRAPW